MNIPKAAILFFDISIELIIYFVYFNSPVVIATMMGSSWQSFKPEIEKKTEHLAGILHQIFALSAKLSLLPVKYAMKLRLPVWQQFCSVADETLTIVNSLVSDMIKTEKDGLLSLMKSEGLTNESDLVRIVSDLVIAAGDTVSVYILIFSSTIIIIMLKLIIINYVDLDRVFDPMGAFSSRPKF